MRLEDDLIRIHVEGVAQEESTLTSISRMFRPPVADVRGALTLDKVAPALNIQPVGVGVASHDVGEFQTEKANISSHELLNIFPLERQCVHRRFGDAIVHSRSRDGLMLDDPHYNVFQSGARGDCAGLQCAT